MAPKQGTDWVIRVSRSYTELGPWIQHLSEKCLRVIAYEHEADEEVSRTHVHLVVIGYSTSDETMKSQIRTHFKTKSFPRSDWVFDNELRDERKAITYASKKDLQAKFNKGYEASFIAECSAEYLSLDEYSNHNRSKVQYKIIPEKAEVARKRQIDHVMAIVKGLQEYHQVGCIYTALSTEKITPRQVHEAIYRELIEKHNEIVGRYKWRDYYDAVTSRIHKAKFIDQMIFMCEK